MLKQFAILLVLASFSSAPVFAAAQFPPAYEAAYEEDNNGQKFKNTVASDGKGKVKSSTETSGGALETLMDYPGKTVTSVIHSQHMYMKQPMLEGYKDETYLKQHAKPLGAKTFNGHPCHGYESSAGPAGSTVQTWVGDDIHVMVHSVAETPKSKLVTDLKSYSAKPGDVTLKIPADYKDFKLPGAR